jgi:polyferredoxin
MSDARLKKWRLASQIAFFSLFSGGILLAGSGFWPFPEDLFFRLDPLIGFIAMFASGALVTGLVLSGFVLILTLVFGRFFCGWICPLGALIDFFEWTTRGYRRKDRDHTRLGQLSLLKYGLLVLIVAASAFSFQFIYLFDPMVITTRFLGQVLLPLRNSILGMPPLVVQHTLWFFLFTLCILLLSFVSRRFWCRSVCPLGALLGLVAGASKSGFIRADCSGCPSCHRKCRTDAIAHTKDRQTRPQECIRCFDCLDNCPTGSRAYRLIVQGEKAKAMSPRISRRAFLAWCGTGVVGSSVIAASAGAMPDSKAILRPPHAPDEATFLDLCIRCQACVNICPTNALQPTLLQSGLYGLWTPSMTPAIGGCSPDCNRCSTVCPTEAIGAFDLSTKYHLKIGTAILSRDRCLPYIDGVQCGKCLTECPTTAIGYVEYEGIRYPAHIDYLLCVGCGLCQNICSRETMHTPALLVTGYGRNMTSGVPENTIEKYIERMQEVQDYAI